MHILPLTITIRAYYVNCNSVSTGKMPCSAVRAGSLSLIRTESQGALRQIVVGFRKRLKIAVCCPLLVCEGNGHWFSFFFLSACPAVCSFNPSVSIEDKFNYLTCSEQFYALGCLKRKLIEHVHFVLESVLFRRGQGSLCNTSDVYKCLLAAIVA
jgi:hypothetical protein